MTAPSAIASRLKLTISSTGFNKYLQNYLNLELETFRNKRI